MSVLVDFQKGLNPSAIMKSSPSDDEATDNGDSSKKQKQINTKSSFGRREHLIWYWIDVLM